MKVLLDTHLLLWAAGAPERLSATALQYLAAESVTRFFSVASLWEIVIKSGLGREDFVVDATSLRRGLLLNGYVELPIASEHAVAVGRLPNVHRDPFDRMLVAQSTVEDITLLTSDPLVARYPGPIRVV